jgi:hypothetical protein
MEAPAKQEVTISHRSSPVVAAYIAFIDTGDRRMSLDHHFTSEALNKLASAMQAIAGANGLTLPQPIDSVNTYASKITEDKYAVSHADNIRRAANIVSAALADLQKAKYPALSADAQTVSEASSKIDPERMTLDQRAAVKNFFQSCADLLRKMN